MKITKLTKLSKLIFCVSLNRLHSYNCDSLCNFYSVKDFQQKLFIEKRRVERLNLKTSVVIFKLSNNVLNGNHKLSLKIDFFIQFICKNIRKTDVVCLRDAYTVVILLPETDSNGAQIMSERVIRRITNNLQKKFGIAGINDGDIEVDILSYPEKSNENSTNKTFPNTNLRENRSDLASVSSALPLKKIKFRQEFFNTNNLCLSTNNGSAISSSFFDIFFWDQELIISMSKFFKKLIKRAMDIIGSIILFILLSPVMLLIALLIKVTSPGKVIFKQNRIGYKGKFFMCYKFRTMKSNNEHKVHEEYVKKLIHGNTCDTNTGSKKKPCYKIQNDPRITSIGKFLRKTSLDELPQFLNVLKGEMSLVGPRPPVLYEVEEYKNWHFRRILEVRPGITGLWQVMGRNKTTFDEMVRLDIRYAENWSILLDIKIILKTIFVVLNLGGQ